MACAKPVIASREGGPAEIITEGVEGLLLPPADPEALAAAISRIHHDPELAGRLGEAGRRRVLADYPEALTVARTAAVYREVLPTPK